MPTMCRGSPRATAASAKTHGSGPRPAMIPSGPFILLASDPTDVALSSGWRRGIVRHTELAIRSNFDEIYHLLGQWVSREHALDILEPLFERPFGREQHAIGLAKLVDLLARKAFSLQPDDVQAAEIGAISNSHTERDKVGGDAGHAANESIRTDAHELMNGGESPDDGAFANRDMTPQGGAVHQRHIIANLAVVSDMRPNHQEAVRPY